MKGEIKTPQQIIDQVREEFEKKCAEMIQKVDITPHAEIFDLSEVMMSTLKAFIEAEIERLKGEKKPPFTGHVGNDTSRAYDMGKNEGYNKALQNQITHLKELLT